MVLQAEIPAEVYSRLVERARATGREESEIVNEALTSYFGDRGVGIRHGPSTEQKWLRAHESEYRGE